MKKRKIVLITVVVLALVLASFGVSAADNYDGMLMVTGSRHYLHYRQLTVTPRPDFSKVTITPDPDGENDEYQGDPDDPGLPAGDEPSARPQNDTTNGGDLGYPAPLMP